MGANNLFIGDLRKVFGIVQSSMLIYPKEMIISTLRDYFSKDSYYHYVQDAWGFPKTPDVTDMPLGSGVHNELTTRIFIGESFRQDITFYPAIIVRSSSSKYTPISINRNQGKVEYESILYEDGYGNSKQINYPASIVTEGAFEGSMSIDVFARSIAERDELVELVSMALTEIYFDDLCKIGLIVKPLDISSLTETEDRKDKLYKGTISFPIRTEWKRVIPINNIINSIVFIVEFQDLKNPNSIPAPNLTISTDITLSELLLNI